MASRDELTSRSKQRFRVGVGPCKSRGRLTSIGYSEIIRRRSPDVYIPQCVPGVLLRSDAPSISSGEEHNETEILPPETQPVPHFPSSIWFCLQNCRPSFGSCPWAGSLANNTGNLPLHMMSEKHFNSGCLWHRHVAVINIF